MAKSARKKYIHGKYRPEKYAGPANMPRPKIADDQKLDFLGWLAAGASRSVAARLAGVGESTISKVRQRDPMFDAAVAAVMPRSGRPHAADLETLKTYLRFIAFGMTPAAARARLGLTQAAVQRSRVIKRDPMFGLKFDMALQRGRLARQTQAANRELVRE